MPWFVYPFVSPNKRTNPSYVFICICLCASKQTHKSPSAPHQNADEKRNSCPAPSSAYPKPKLDKKRKPRQPTSSVARRWHVARAVPSAPPLDEKRPPPLPERGLPRGAEPLSDVERGSRGNHRRFPPLLSLPFQRERKKHITIFIFVQTHLETGSLLSTYKKMSFSPNPKRNELSV